MFDKQITLFDTKAPTEVRQFSDADLKDLKGSITPNTKRAYAGHLRRLFEFAAIEGATELTDTTLRDFCHHLESQGKSPATISQAIAAAVFWAKIQGTPSPAGELTDRAIKRIRREHKKRGRGQAQPLTLDGFAAICATACRPRQRAKRGIESKQTAQRRGTLDKAIAGLLFHAGLRRSEAAALTWGDIEPAPHTPDALLIHIRSSKTDQTGERTDIRLIKNGATAAVQALRPDDPGSSDLVLGLSADSIARRFKAACKAAGIEGKISAHSGRVGLASELTRLGASTTATMLAGGWSTSRMVAHYSAGATAENGAVAKYF